MVDNEFGIVSNIKLASDSPGEFFFFVTPPHFFVPPTDGLEHVSMDAHITPPEVIDVARVGPPVVMGGEMAGKHIIYRVDGSTGVRRLCFEDIVGFFKISWLGSRIVIEKHYLVA